MSINPYQSPEDEPTPSTGHVEVYGTRRYRVLVALGGFSLVVHNLYVFGFMALFFMKIPWPLLSGQRGLLVPGHGDSGVGVDTVPMACLTVLGNWYLVGLTLWLLAHRRSELGWTRRLLFVALVFIPVWGVRKFRHLVGSGDESNKVRQPANDDPTSSK